MKEAMEKIKKAEENANNIVNDGNTKAKEILSEAKKKSLKLYDDTIQKNKEDFEKKLNQSVSNLKDELSIEIENALTKAKEITDSAKKNGTDVANKILDELLK